MRIYFVLYLLTIGAFRLDAQNKCSTSGYMDLELKNDISLKNRIDQIESFSQKNNENNFAEFRTQRLKQVIKIPVIFHILYRTVDENISSERITAQLAALNRDFRKKNSDTINTPQSFIPFAVDMEIEFYLAKSDPHGKSTTGIERIYTPVSYWYSDDKMKFKSSYGADAWDSKSYLNIWICKLDDVLGYSTFPGNNFKKDGIVISYNELNGIGTIDSNNGRTLVHEVGHWLNLKHIWGDNYCGDDNIDDTPKQSTYTPGCPAGIRQSCGNTKNGDMYMNYMDFTDDVCMNMFTKGQKIRARSLFEPGGYRNSILHSSAFNTPAIFAAQVPDYHPEWLDVKTYPNPAKDNININTEYDARWIGKVIDVIDMTGRIVLKTSIKSSVQSIYTSRLAPGVYFIRLEKEGEKVMRKFVKL
jgi:hypothetical protein